MTAFNQDAKDRLVLIVEDDENLREAITITLRVREIAYQEFKSAQDVSAFLNGARESRPTCMLLDIRLGTGPSGLSVFDEVSDLGLTNKIPVIFMTGHGDLETAIDVMRLGAFDFVAKPFSTPDLLKKIESALCKSEEVCDREQEKQKVLALTEQLTEKETGVMHLMISGKTNREIAEVCGNSTRTVELHRARIFDKLQVSNAVELVRVLTILDS